MNPRMPSRTLLLAIVLSLSALPAQALHFFVDGAPAGKGDDRRSVQSAQNSATPYRTITHALRVAHLIGEGRPHVIELAPGTYAPSTGETFPLVITQRNIYLKPTGTTILDAEGRSNFFRLTPAAGNFPIQNFVFFNGRAEQGGAIYCDSCSLRVEGNRFFYNQASAGGHVFYARSGQVAFANNLLRNNGSSTSDAPVVELHDTFADTSYRDVIRNNTFYRNYSPDILTSGNRTDIDSNIFLDSGEPPIVDASTSFDPLVRYNLFWDNEVLLITDRADSITVSRTVRDTVTLAEQSIVVPEFMTGPPDTLATTGQLYEFEIPVEGNRDSYKFTYIPLSGNIKQPAGVDTALIRQKGVVRWTPALADTGRYYLNIEMIFTSGGISKSLYYFIHVYAPEDVPANPGPIVFVSFVPDTVGALNTLNQLAPSFSSAVSAGHNLYAYPIFPDSAYNHFDPRPGSPAIDAGNPIVALRDSPGQGSGTRRNDIGYTGGPGLPDPPPPNTGFSELEFLNLPDSVAVEGQVYTYDPVLKVADKILVIDLIQQLNPPPTMSLSFGSGKRPPITWTPTLADTGTYLIGVEVYTNSGQGRHYFPLRVRPLNRPPEVTGLPDTLALEDSTYAYTIQATDANGDTLSFVLVSGPAGMSIDARTGQLSWTPAQKDVGSTQIEVRVDDGKGASTLHRFTLTVVNTNDPPTITSTPDTIAVEDTPYIYTLKVADPDPGDGLTFSLGTAPAGMRLDSTGQLSWTPTQQNVGVHAIAVRVADLAGATAEQRFSLRVIEVDDPPQIASQPDTLAFEDQLYQYAVQGVDEEGKPLTYSLETAPAGMNIDSTGQLSWTPAQKDVGVHAIAVRIADPAGQAAIQRFELRVQAVNDPPRITRVEPPADSLLIVPPGVRLLFLVEAVDEDSDSLRFSWRVNGVQRGTGASLEHLPSAAVVDTLTALVSDGIDTTSVTWFIDGRQVLHLSVAVDPVDFGAVTIGDTGRVALTVASIGNGPLTLRDLQVDDQRFAATFSSGSVPAGDTAILELRFAPTDLRAVASAVTFATDDPDWPVVRIPMRGTGIVPTRLSLDLDPATGPQNLSQVDVAPGGEFTLALYAEKALDLIRFEARLTFDPIILRFVSIGARNADETNLLEREGSPADASATVLEDTSVAVVVVAPGTGEGISGDGLLGLLTFAVDSSFAAQEQTILRQDLAVLHSQALGPPDTLRPELRVVLRPLLLPGDFDGDGVVDFEDFFLFADQFGTTPESPNWDPRFSLDGDEDVDFEDFFLFADQFGRTVRDTRSLIGDYGNAAVKPASLPLDLLDLSVLPQTDDRPEVIIRWQGEQPLRGYVLSLEFDPEQLAFEEFAAAADPRPLLWVVDSRPGVLTVAAGLTAGQEAFHSADLGILRFARLAPDAATLESAGALVRFRDRTRYLVPPSRLSLAALPRASTLYPPYPNPFNPAVALTLYLPQETEMRLRVYDLLGRPVRTLADGPLAQGFHTFSWQGRDQDGRPVGAGLYLAELRTGELRQVRKLLLLK